MSGGWVVSVVGASDARDNEVLLGSFTSLANGAVSSLNETWASIVANYDEVRFQVSSPVSTTDYTHTASVKTNALDGASLKRLSLYGDGTNGLNVDITTANFTTDEFTYTPSGLFGAGDIDVYGVRNQTTVLAGMVTPEDLVETHSVVSVNSRGTVGNFVLTAIEDAGPGVSINGNGELVIEAGYHFEGVFDLTKANFDSSNGGSQVAFQWWDVDANQAIGKAGHKYIYKASSNINWTAAARVRFAAGTTARTIVPRLTVDSLFRDAADIACLISVRPAQKTVVMPDALEVEDASWVKLYEGIDGANGTSSSATLSLDNGATFDGSLYEAFVFTGGTGTSQMLASVIYKAEDLVNAGFDIISDDGVGVAIRVGGLNLGGSTMSYQPLGSVTNRSLRVYGIPKQKTVINTTDTPTDDQTASGYFDIGNMRMQWGQTFLGSGSGETISLPAAFANNTYSFTANGHHPDDPRTISIQGQTTTDVTVDMWKSDDRTVATGLINWKAIGFKP